jgi:hypothetical protein
VTDLEPAGTLGGWLMTPEQTGGMARYDELRHRLPGEAKMTFASHFAHQVSFAERMTRQVLQGADGDRREVRGPAAGMRRQPQRRLRR